MSGGFYDTFGEYTRLLIDNEEHRAVAALNEQRGGRDRSDDARKRGQVRIGFPAGLAVRVREADDQEGGQCEAGEARHIPLRLRHLLAGTRSIRDGRMPPGTSRVQPIFVKESEKSKGKG
jgi:hypothetical protein